MNNNISDKDKKDWENFLSNDEKLTDKDLKIKNKKSLKIKSIDLHGYTLEQANVAVENFIIRSYEEQIGKLIIVTGKGLHSTSDKDVYVSKDLSKLKFSVPEFINNNEDLSKYIISISDASIREGGTGAILIKLKNL